MQEKSHIKVRLSGPMTDKQMEDVAALMASMDLGTRQMPKMTAQEILQSLNDRMADGNEVEFVGEKFVGETTDFSLGLQECGVAYVLFDAGFHDAWSGYWKFFDPSAGLAFTMPGNVYGPMVPLRDVERELATGDLQQKIALSMRMMGALSVSRPSRQRPRR